MSAHRYIYDDAHGHRLTIEPAYGASKQRYVRLGVDCLDIGGEWADAWLCVSDAERLRDALVERVPYESSDHMGDALTVAPSAAWTTFTVVRAARDDDEAPTTVRCVVLTGRLPEVAAALAAHAELAAYRRAREESPLGSERLAEIRSLDLLVMMSDRSAAVVGRALGDLLTELDRLRARVAELEAGLPAMQEALFRALDRVAELESERHSTNEALSDAAVALRAAESQAAELARVRSRVAHTYEAHSGYRPRSQVTYTLRCLLWDIDHPAAADQTSDVWSAWLDEVEPRFPTGELVHPDVVADTKAVGDRMYVERVAAELGMDPHPAPCRVPASPDCTCGPADEGGDKLRAALVDGWTDTTGPGDAS